jgi:ribosomal protein S18 acetylase RimI-like enzyme
VSSLENLAIRFAGEPDIEKVLDLWARAGAPPSVSDTHQGLSRLLRSDPQALLLAIRHEALIGSLIAVFDGWRASFYRLAVDPDHRRQGVASALLAEAERRLAELGAARLTAIVAAEDPRAMGFWRAAGYDRQEHRTRFVKLTEGH